MWLPVAAVILGAIAVRYDVMSLLLVFGAYAFCLFIVQVKVKTIKPKEAATLIKKPWPQDQYESMVEDEKLFGKDGK